MKKSLIALAALAAAGAVSAQSSVTMYGLIDQGVSKSNTGATVSAGKNDGIAVPGATVVKQGQSSRLGFRGVEDLGGGLKAVFNFEHRFTPDNGEAAGPFWQARSVVGLEGGFGRVLLGRDYVPAFWVALAGDPTGWNYVSQASSSYTFAGYTARDTLIRNNNTVAYKSPSFGGLTAEVQVAAGEGNATKGRSVGFNAQYAAGPIYAGVAYDSYTTPGNDPKLVIAGFAYDLGFVRPQVTYSKATNIAPGNTTNVTLAATAPIGTARAMISYSKAKVDGAGNADRQKLGLGYYYPLSKRTTIYTNLGSAKVENADRSTAYDLGVTHTF